MDGGGATDGTARKWRKKKKSFLTKAKRNEKQDRCGRGAAIPQDTYSYLLASFEILKKGFEDKENRQTFVDNVLEKTENEEILLSSNQLGCRLIEELLPDANEQTLDRFVEAFSKQLRTISSDLYASFVLEQLLSVCTSRAVQHLQNSDTESEEPPLKKSKGKDNEIKYSDEHIGMCHAFAIKISKYLLNNLEDFVWDPIANRIIRTSLKCMGGVVSAPCEKMKTEVIKLVDNELEPSLNNKEKPGNKKNLPLVYKEVPDEFKEILLEYANRLSQWPQFTNMPYETLTSGLLQILMFALKNCDKKLANQIGKKLLLESFLENSNDPVDNDDDDKKCIDVDDKKEIDEVSVKPLNLPPVFDSEPAVRLLEAVLYCVRKKTYTQIYAMCFINRLAILATLPGLNFTVQRLFDNCLVKEEFEPMFDELAEKFDKILICGNTGVLVAVAKACLRLKARQVKFITSMETALKCTNSQEKYLAVLCLRLLPSDRVDLTKFNEPYFINVHGSVILQSMLGFQRPKKLIDSLLALSPKELLIIFCDPKGCHVADTFCDGEFVGAKSKELLVRRLKGTFQEMAISKHGSRAVESLFKMSSVEFKVKIMEELSNKSQLLNASMFGTLIAQKLNVELYKKSFNSWKSSIDKENKIKDSFKDITGKRKLKDNN